MSVETWEVDPGRSKLSFSVRHLLVGKVRGTFNRWKAMLRIDEENWENSSVEVEIEAASIDTGNAGRDTQLRSPDLLDVRRFPWLRFHSTGFQRLDGERYQLVGELTNGRVSQKAVIAVRREGGSHSPKSPRQQAFSGSCTLNRRDFGVQWNRLVEVGGLAVGDQIDVQLQVVANLVSSESRRRTPPR